MSHCSNINLFIIFAFFAAKRFDLLFSMFSSGVMSQCFSIMVCNVPSRINGLLFKPNNILVKRKATMLGLSAVIESYQRNRKKSRWDWLTSIWRNACLISATRAIFPHRKRKRISDNFGKRHSPAYNKSFRKGSSDCFEDASNTTCIFVVSLSDFITALCGNNESSLAQYFDLKVLSLLRPYSNSHL